MRHWTKSPLKIIMTLTAVALGTGILILSMSASSILKTEVSDQLDANGSILYAANGEWDSDGGIDQNRPPEWDAKIIDYIRSDIESVTAAAVVVTPPFNSLSSNGKSYDLRSAVGSEPEYFDVFSLEIIAGMEMTDNDITTGQRKVWISEEMAKLLYGSAEAAIGNWIQPPGSVLNRGPGRNREQNMIINYSVTGVYETPDEIIRNAYGIGDLVFPYTSLIEGGSNITMMLDMMAGTFVIKSTGATSGRTEAALRQLIETNYGYNIDTVIWEGSPRGESSYMEELRRTVDMFTVSVNILGIVLLLTSSLGIFSIMVVEALSRRGEIALERALGASRRLVVKEFWSWSLTLSLTGAVIGVILAAVLAQPVLQSLSPLAGEVSSQFKSASGIKVQAVLLSVLMAISFGGVLGLLPAFSAVRGNIAETIRDV